MNNNLKNFYLGDKIYKIKMYIFQLIKIFFL